MKKINYIFLIIISCQVFAQSNYKLETIRETALLNTGISASSIAIYLISKIEPPSEQEILSLSRVNVNSIDRFATYNWSPTLSDISDVLLITQMLSPAMLLTSDKIRNDSETFLTMNLELYLLYYGTVHITKSLTGRYRPFMYNEKVSIREKVNPDSKLSFFSGHASLSFASAVFLSSIYSKYYPDSKWKAAVWGTTLFSAAFISYLRVASGMHYLTDVITGAAFGSLIGYLIPLIHKTENNKNTIAGNLINQKLVNLIIVF